MTDDEFFLHWQSNRVRFRELREERDQARERSDEAQARSVALLSAAAEDGVDFSLPGRHREQWAMVYAAWVRERDAMDDFKRASDQFERAMRHPEGLVDVG